MPTGTINAVEQDLPATAGTVDLRPAVQAPVDLDLDEVRGELVAVALTELSPDLDHGLLVVLQRCERARLREVRRRCNVHHGGHDGVHVRRVDHLVRPGAAQQPALVAVLLERPMGRPVQPPITDLGERLPYLDELGEALLDDRLGRGEVELLAPAERRVLISPPRLGTADVRRLSRGPTTGRRGSADSSGERRDGHSRGAGRGDGEAGSP
jgi:hypothetical protein